ncbi:hypothetical protein [Kocuria rosea]|uniref:hypothetical protein n=1 Tax=Kocuria rosea TaxID=1275 RepID=UPI0025B7911E|nr:hypothetical protein [Kocuria rosea]WJZ68591.1 hypothetical protein QR564_19170 [Kocuria rosea]
MQVAPVVKADEATARDAKLLRRPRFVGLPHLNDSSLVADLDRITTVEKAYLATRSKLPARLSDDQARRFAFGVARKFGRVALPDAVVQVLDPVTSELASKARREASPMGRLLQQVDEVRIEASWSHVPTDITVLFIVKPGLLPSDEDLMPDLESPKINQHRIADTQRVKTKVSGLADLILNPVLSDAERLAAWSLFGDRISQEITDQISIHNAEESVRSVSTDVITVDEIPYSRILKSELLDLECACPDQRFSD